MKLVKEMAFEPGKTSKFIHPTRKKWIETGDPEIDAILPDMSVQEQSYLEYITSKAYQKMVDRLEHYFQKKASELSLPSVLSVFVSSLQELQELEKRHKERLEQIALEAVLSLEEFEMVKEAYEDGQVKFDVALAPASLQMPEVQAQEGELSEAEQINMELGEEIMEDARLNRRFANMMIQGGSMLKMYLFNLVSDKLQKIDPKLIKYYGAVATCAQVGYWAFPRDENMHLVEQMASEIAGGSEQVEPEEEIYVIKARGVCFPYLVYEISKGIYEWLSLNKEQALAYSKDTFSDEIDDTIVGAELFASIQKMVKNQKLWPLVYKKIIAAPLSTKKEIAAGTDRGKSILASLEREAQEEWQDYLASKEQDQEEEEEDETEIA